MGYDLENRLKENENEQNVSSTAVAEAKKNMAAKKLEKEAKEVERRLSTAENTENSALKELRMARKKEEAQKKYLEAVSAAKTQFESDGNCQAYDKAIDKAEEERDKMISEAKRNIYGLDDYWKY